MNCPLHITHDTNCVQCVNALASQGINHAQQGIYNQGQYQGINQAQQGIYSQGQLVNYQNRMWEQLETLKVLDAPKSMYIKLYIKKLSIYNSKIRYDSRIRFDDMFLGMCKELKIDIDANDIENAELLQ